jgi:hypothetical protein
MLLPNEPLTHGGGGARKCMPCQVLQLWMGVAMHFNFGIPHSVHLTLLLLLLAGWLAVRWWLLLLPAGDGGAGPVCTACSKKQIKYFSAPFMLQEAYYCLRCARWSLHACMPFRYLVVGVVTVHACTHERLPDAQTDMARLAKRC